MTPAVPAIPAQERTFVEAFFIDLEPTPWSATDDRLRDLPEAYEAWLDEARGDA